MDGQRIGVLGGTFDPVHVGHLVAAEEVRYRLSLDRVRFLPNRQPPHKATDAVSDPTHRVEMVRLAIAHNPGFQLDLTEIDRPGPSYAVDTLRLLPRKLHPSTRLFFLVGLEALFTLESWHEPDALLTEFDVVAMDRPAEPDDARKRQWETLERRFPTVHERVITVHVPQVSISGHDIRRRVATGEPIRYQVPLEVERYIQANALYLNP